MQGKRKLLPILLIVVLLLGIVIGLVSCDFLGGEDKTVKQAPKITGFRVEKISTDYVDEEGNPSFYNEEGSVMPVSNGESLYVFISYSNPSELAINNVYINGKNYKAVNFEPESTTSETKIKITMDDVLVATERTFRVDKVYYANGSQVMQIVTIAPDVDMSFTLNIAPEFTLRLNHLNSDALEVHKVKYYADMGSYIPEVNFVNPSPTAPIKGSGWFFMGYYTEENGKGLQVDDTQKFYFWNDVTLYAYYEMLYTYEIIDIPSLVINTEQDPKKEPNNVTVTKGVRILDLTDCGDYQEQMVVPDTMVVNNQIYPIVELAPKAFQGSGKMVNLSLGRYISKIDEYALSESDVVSINFPSGCSLKTIGKGAFLATDNLGSGTTGFTIPETVTYIGAEAFKDSGWSRTTNKTSTVITTLHVKSHIKHIGDRAFKNTAFTGVVFDAGLGLKHDAVDGTPYPGSEYDLYFGIEAFSDCVKLKSVVLSPSEGFLGEPDYLPALEFIPERCFDIMFYSMSATTGLTSLTLNEGVKIIGAEAFYYQKLLTSLNIPNSVERLESGAFRDCLKVSSINFVDENSQLKYIGLHAWWNNKPLTTVVIPSKVLETFGNGIFQGCDKLLEVYFNFTTPPKGEYREKGTPKQADLFYASLEFKVFVPSEAVEGFRTSVRLGNKNNVENQILSKDRIYEIEFTPRGSEISRKCKVALEVYQRDPVTQAITAYSLGHYFGDEEDIIIPDAYEGIPIKAISALAIHKNVVSLTLPSGIEELKVKALAGTTRLKNLHFGDEENVGLDNLKTIGQQAFYQSGITGFKGGKKLSSIGLNAFWECKSLAWVNLGECVLLTDELKEQAFQKCTSLTYVELPENLSKMEAGVFASCTILSTVVFKNQTLPNDFWNATTPFGDIKKDTTTLYFVDEVTKNNFFTAKNSPNQMVKFAYQNVPTAPWNLV